MNFVDHFVVCVEFKNELFVCRYCDEKPEKVEVPAVAASPETKQQEDTIRNFFYRVSGEVS